MKSGASGLASVSVLIQLYDSSGNQLNSQTILNAQTSSTRQYFDGNTAYTGNIGWSVSGYQSYQVRWYVHVYAQTNGISDFYSTPNNYWLLMSMTIVTPSGQAPV
ncbi:MAG: hypothetical protein LYZ70_05655 [Nitrososphaerales archaeon]|nr:hypothetical protein [Nitrososphaerales archaeon]